MGQSQPHCRRRPPLPRSPHPGLEAPHAPPLQRSRVSRGDDTRTVFDVSKLAGMNEKYKFYVVLMSKVFHDTSNHQIKNAQVV